MRLRLAYLTERRECMTRKKRSKISKWLLTILRLFTYDYLHKPSASGIEKKIENQEREREREGTERIMTISL